MKIIAIIPARYASTRFPGKPLALIANKPMIQHVYERAVATGLFEKVIVATDSDEIADCVTGFGGEFAMTHPDHQSGTDRCGEVVESLSSDFDVVINIQGDEPMIKKEQLQQLVGIFEEPAAEIATLKKALTSIEEVLNPNVVKLVTNIEGKAIYFSRSPIPFVRNHASTEWLKHQKFYKHLGLYGYRTVVLKKLVNLKPSELELSESLEQLRWLENGYNIYVAETAFESIGVDTPEDLNKLKDVQF